MMKQIILFLVLIFSTGCVAETTRSQLQPTPPKNIATSTPKSIPSSFPELSAADSRRLDEKFPKQSRQILEQAEKIELFEFESCIEAFSPELGQIEPKKFQGCRITRKAIIKDANLKQKLLEGLFYGVGSANGGMACFSPHHGVRAIHKNDRVDLVICFECERFKGASSAGEVGGLITMATSELFEQILTNAKKN